MGFTQKVALVFMAVAFHKTVSSAGIQKSTRENPFEKYLHRKYTCKNNLLSKPILERQPSQVLYKAFPSFDDKSPIDVYDSTLIKNLKKEKKSKRNNRNIEKPLSEATTATLSEPFKCKETAFYNTEKGSFPEVQYPLSASEVWSPCYWNTRLSKNNNSCPTNSDINYQNKKKKQQYMNIFLKSSANQINKGIVDIFCNVKKNCTPKVEKSATEMSTIKNDGMPIGNSQELKNKTTETKDSEMVTDNLNFDSNQNKLDILNYTVIKTLAEDLQKIKSDTSEMQLFAKELSEIMRQFNKNSCMDNSSEMSCDPIETGSQVINAEDSFENKTTVVLDNSSFIISTGDNADDDNSVNNIIDMHLFDNQETLTLPQTTEESTAGNEADIMKSTLNKSLIELSPQSTEDLNSVDEAKITSTSDNDLNENFVTNIINTGSENPTPGFENVINKNPLVNFGKTSFFDIDNDNITLNQSILTESSHLETTSIPATSDDAISIEKSESSGKMEILDTIIDDSNINNVKTPVSNAEVIQKMAGDAIANSTPDMPTQKLDTSTIGGLDEVTKVDTPPALPVLVSG